MYQLHPAQNKQPTGACRGVPTVLPGVLSAYAELHQPGDPQLPLAAPKCRSKEKFDLHPSQLHFRRRTVSLP